MLEGHISRAFDGALAALHIRVVEMGGLVLDQVREAAAPIPTGRWVPQGTCWSASRKSTNTTPAWTKSN